LANVLYGVALVHLFRREGHGFAQWLGYGTSLQGWALVERASRSGAREPGEAGLGQLQERLAALPATGAEIWAPLFLGALAQGYAQGGQAQAGLRVVAEALTMVEKNEERWNEADLYRLKGELTLQQSEVQSPGSEVFSPQEVAEAEACFHKAIDIARHQQAKSLELRAARSLARLWQQQGKQAEAHKLLSEIYHWFTEGFGTKDLQEAKALLDEMARGV
jgi:predicted ATPase